MEQQLSDEKIRSGFASLSVVVEEIRTAFADLQPEAVRELIDSAAQDVRHASPSSCPFFL
jgi:hypothetical protein